MHLTDSYSIFLPIPSYRAWWITLLFAVLLVCLHSAVGVSLAAAQSTGEAPAFSYNDTFSLEWATSPEIQPSGEHVVYIRNGMDKMKDRRTGRLWLVARDGSMHRKLTGHDHSEYGARWSPDGTEIAYVAATEGNGSEIMVYSLETRQATRITQLETSPADLRWSPDGSQIAFNMLVRQDPPPYEVDLPSPPEGAEWAKSPTVLTRLRHEADGRGDLPHGFRHVFVVPADGGTSRQITSGDYNHGGAVSWLPDGTGFVFSANRSDNWEYDRVESEIHLATLDGDITTLTNRNGPDSSPVVSPDGEQIAYTGFDDQVQTFQNSQLYVMNADGSGQQLLTGDLDRSVSDPIWDASGDGIYVSYLNNGLTEVAKIDLAGSVEVISESGGGVAVGRPYAGGTYSVDRNGQVAFTHGTTDDLANIAIAGSGAPEVLTDLNNDLLPHRTLGQVEEVTWDAPDGRTIHGWVVRPPNFDKEEEYPLLLEIHGGPISSYGPVFSPEIQLYAAGGYVVLYANPRGSTGYSEAFANLLYHDYPGGDYSDLMAGVDMMLDQGFIDRDRMYVTGGSAGGTMTAWIVGSTDRFRAASVHKPVMNWYSKTLVADNYYGYANYRYPGYAWENPEKYLEESPISVVGNVETPTMVMVGTDDLRTPPSEARQLYHALKIRKIDTALVEVPGASHGIASRPSQLNAKVAYTISWFKRYE